MLEEKLAVARQQSSQLRKRLVIGFLIITTLCGLVLFGLSSFDFSAKEAPAEEMPTKPISKEGVPTEINVDQAREEFKKILQQYKSELEPQLNAANIAQWNQAALTEINTLEQSAMSHFSQGDYTKALDQIQSLQTKAATTLEDAQQIFKENMQKAAASFAEDKYNEAKSHIDKALMVNAQSPDALALQQDIEKLKQLLPLLNEAKVARTENNLHKEYRALQQILDIAPNRQQAAERYKLLGQRIRSSQFETHIAAGFSAIKKQQTQKARQHYQKAKKVSSTRKALRVLLNQITKQERARRIESTMQQAKLAIRRDNWQQVKASYSKALQDTPKNKTALDGLKRANEILTLQAQLTQYTKDPYRLANNNVLSAAEKTLTQAQPMLNYSLGLKKQTQQLRALITTFNQLIPVTITSDDRTFVIIRGVGKIGNISQKSLKLKPGRYTFEGTRDGYKSKLLPVLIPYNKNSFSIRVVSDEPI